MEKLSIKIGDMKNPEHGETIKKHLATFEGINNVEVDIENNMVIVESTCSPEELVCEVKKLGYYNVNVTNM